MTLRRGREPQSSEQGISSRHVKPTSMAWRHCLRGGLCQGHTAVPGGSVPCVGQAQVCVTVCSGRMCGGCRPLRGRPGPAAAGRRDGRPQGPRAVALWPPPLGARPAAEPPGAWRLPAPPGRAVPTSTGPAPGGAGGRPRDGGRRREAPGPGLGPGLPCAGQDPDASVGCFGDGALTTPQRSLPQRRCSPGLGEAKW